MACGAKSAKFASAKAAPAPASRDPHEPEREARTVTPEELARERAASAERRKKQLEDARRERPVQEWTATRTLSKAERLRLKDDDYVPPTE